LSKLISATKKHNNRKQVDVDLQKLKIFLDKKVDEYNQPNFIKNDPVYIPHLFSKKQDIEIAGFFAAVFAWGNRTTIINKSKQLMQLMDNAPFEFCVNHTSSDLKKLLTFKHRTFNETDLLYFIEFLVCIIQAYVFWRLLYIYIMEVEV